MATGIVEKIGLLLRQAEGASTDHERDAYMSKAQQLATVNAVDMAMARQAVAKREEREQPIQKTVKWDRGTSRDLKSHLVRLFGAVAGPNDVKNNIFHDSSGVIAFGFPSDIDVVEVLFASLAVQMTAAGDAYIASGAYKSETVMADIYETEKYTDYYGRERSERVYVGRGEKPVHGRTARSNFYQGFVVAIQRRLQDARTETLEQMREAEEQTHFHAESGRDYLDIAADTMGADATDDEILALALDMESRAGQTPENDSATMVLAAKGLEVQDFYKQTSTARGSWRGGSSAAHVGGARSAGSAAGQQARLTSQRGIAA